MTDLTPGQDTPDERDPDGIPPSDSRAVYYFEPASSSFIPEANAEAVVWLDMVPTKQNGKAELLEEITALANPDEVRYAEEIADDLADMDVWPEVGRFGPVRKLSVTAILAHGEDATPDEQTAVFASRVEIAIGANWVITAWHPISVLTQLDNDEVAPNTIDGLRAATYATVTSNLYAHDLTRSGDLALAILGASVGSFSAKRRDGHQALDDWEAVYYSEKFVKQSTTTPHVDETLRLAEIHSAAVALSRQLEHLSAPRERAASHWVGSDLSSEEGIEYAGILDEKIDRYAISLRDLRDRVRAGLEMSHSVASVERDIESRHRDYFIAKLAAVFLAPTLVAGFYGINTKYPDYGTTKGTVEALVLMVFSAVAAWGGIKLFESAAARKRRQSNAD